MPRTESPVLPFKTVAIVGIGLIGGSLGLAIKKHFPRLTVIGSDQPSVAKQAAERKAIDKAAPSLQQAVEGADLIVLATPIKTILELLPQCAKFAKPGAIITDVGSVKSEIVRRAEKVFPDGNFIGGHPMAGVELSGIGAAHPLLFENAVYVLSPSANTKRGQLQRLSEFFHGLGARVLVLDRETHDSVAAAVSHLPQLTAVALMNVVGKRHKEASRHISLAAGGFRDLTRIASSKFDIWGDILASNKKEIDASLQLFIQELESYRRAIVSGERDLEQEFNSSRTLRARIPKTMKGFLHPLSDLFVFVNDKPGQLAKITAVLAEAQLNIKDIELVKVREGAGGTFRLSFADDAEKEFARRLLEKAGFEVGS